MEEQKKSMVLLNAVESLKAAGLSGIGSVVQTSSPEYLDAASEIVSVVQSTTAADQSSLDAADRSPVEIISVVQKKKVTTPPPATAAVLTSPVQLDLTKLNESMESSKKNQSQQDLSAVSLHICEETVSAIGTALSEFDAATISTAIEVETKASAAKSETAGAGPITPIETHLPPANGSGSIDCRYTIEECTKMCSKGKDLWKRGRCEAALLEFRRALLGLESLLGTHHLLVSKLYHWMGQVFLRLVEDGDRSSSSKATTPKADAEQRKRAWADAAVESLTWSLKIRYLSRDGIASETSTEDDSSSSATNDSAEESETEEAIEDSLKRAWKVQATEWSSFASSFNSTHHEKPKCLANLREAIRIERKADLALFRLEKNQLSDAVDVYSSLVQQYNKAIAACSDDGAFSSLTKMAYWYHKLGRIRSEMDEEDGEDAFSPALRSLSSAPLDATEHSKSHNNLNGGKKSRSREYFELAAFWYRMALEVFCTGIGRCDKTNDHSHIDYIDITVHPTYQQLILRLKQVLYDHGISGKEVDYLQTMGVRESIVRHNEARQAMREHKRLTRNKEDSLERLEATRDVLASAQDGFRDTLDIERSTWGHNHIIAAGLQRELRRANRLREKVENEIVDFPEKQAQREQQKREQQKLEQLKREQKRLVQEKAEQQSDSSTSEDSSSESSSSESSSSEDSDVERERIEKERIEKERLEQEKLERERLEQEKLEREKLERKKLEQERLEREKLERKKLELQKRKEQEKEKQRQKSALNHNIETLRRLQDEVLQSRKLLEARTVERDRFRADHDRLRADLRSKNGEIQKTLAAAARKEEEALQIKLNCESALSEREALLNHIKRLEHKISISEQKQRQLEFSMNKEGADLAQSATQKEVELMYWKQKFEAAQSEWTECQFKYEEDLREARADSGKKDAELMEWRGRYEGLDGEWKSREGQVDYLRKENERLQREVRSALAVRKEMEYSRKMNDLEIAHSKEQQVLDAIMKAAKSDSEAAAWKRKYNVAQKEWLSSQGKADVKTREAIADATCKTAELVNWKRRFEVAQREWLELQTRAETQARTAVATAKRYEVSHSEMKEKFVATQNALKSLIDQNNQLRKQIVTSQSRQDQLEFTLKKQAIDFAKVQDTLNRKTAEAQCWKDQCQASQQAQKQITHEMQLSRATDGNLQDRIIDLRQQNVDLKERVKELQVDQERKKLDLEAKTKEIAVIKESALKRIRQLKKEQHQNDPNQRDLKERKTDSVGPKPTGTKDGTKGPEFTKLEEELAQAKRKNLKLEKELSTLRKDLSTEDTTAGPSDPKGLAAKLGRTQRALDYVEKDYKDSLEEIKALTKAKSLMEGNITDAQEIISLLKAANNERIEQCSNLEDEKNRMKQELKESQARAESNAALETELEKSLADKDALLARVKELESQSGVSDSEHNINDMTQRISNLESELDKSESQNKKLLSDVKKYKLQSQSRQASESPKKPRGRERSRRFSNETHQEANEQIKTLSERCTQLERELAASNKQIEKLRTQTRDYSAKTWATEGNDYEKNVIQDLERELVESTKIRKNLSTQLKACREKIALAEEREKEHQTLTKEFKRLEGKLEQSTQSREEMSSQLSSLKKRLARAEAKEDESSILENELSKLEQKLEESSNENNKLQSQIDNLTSTVGSEDEQRQYLLHQISTLEKELVDSKKENKILKTEIDKLEKVSDIMTNVEEEKDELKDKCKKLEAQYNEAKQQAEQSSKSLATMLEVESKEQKRVKQENAKLEKNLHEKSKRNVELESEIDEMRQRNKELEEASQDKERVRREFSKLEKDFQETSKRNIYLESRVDEMRQRNIDRLSAYNTGECSQCIVLGDELRSTIEQNDKHIQATEKFHDEHDKLLDRCNFLENELKEAIEVNENLESQLIGGSNSNDDKYQELNIRCIQLEEELRDANDLNDKRTSQLDALKRKMTDLEAYADDTASDLEQAERMISAMKSEGAGGGVEYTLLLERCNKLQRQLKDFRKENESLSHQLETRNKEMSSKEDVHNSSDDNIEGSKAGVTSEQTGLQELNMLNEVNEKLNIVTSARDELAELLKKTTDECEHQKRLKGHVEKDRDYLDKMYNECKEEIAKVQADLDATKENLKKSNEEKEELERQLQIEKHVSHSLKTSKNTCGDEDSEENELEELYRQARDELAEVEAMLFETEEELDTLKSKYQKLQQEKSNSDGSPTNGPAGSSESSEIIHDLQDLTRDELMVETKKALRKLQETQTKVVDLQETNMILQAQLKSSLTFKEKNKRPPARNNNGNKGGFWSLRGRDGGKNTNSGSDNAGEAEDKDKEKITEPKETPTNQNEDEGAAGGFWSLRGRARGGQ